MNFGECPYDDCDEILWLSLPDKPLPIIARITCDGCGREVWYKFSRLNPEAWTPEQFDAIWERDEETKAVTRRT